jgi:hypothetical protein
MNSPKKITIKRVHADNNYKIFEKEVFNQSLINTPTENERLLLFNSIEEKDKALKALKEERDQFLELYNQSINELREFEKIKYQNIDLMISSILATALITIGGILFVLEHSFMSLPILANKFIGGTAIILGCIFNIFKTSNIQFLFASLKKWKK